jgi:hypothetical protein
LGGRAYIIKKKTEALVAASKEIELEVNADKTKCIVTSRDQNDGRSHNIKTDNRSFERVEQFKYLLTTIPNQNSTQVKITSTLNSGNASYHSVNSNLSSSLLSKNREIRIHRTIILPVVLYGSENCTYGRMTNMYMF